MRQKRQNSAALSKAQLWQDGKNARKRLVPQTARLPVEADRSTPARAAPQIPDRGRRQIRHRRNRKASRFCVSCRHNLLALLEKFRQQGAQGGRFSGRAHLPLENIANPSHSSPNLTIKRPAMVLGMPRRLRTPSWKTGGCKILPAPPKNENCPPASCRPDIRRQKQRPPSWARRVCKRFAPLLRQDVPLRSCSQSARPPW